MRDIKKIIKEEIDDLDWIRGIEPFHINDLGHPWVIINDTDSGGDIQDYLFSNGKTWSDGRILKSFTDMQAYSSLWSKDEHSDRFGFLSANLIELSDERVRERLRYVFDAPSNEYSVDDLNIFRWSDIKFRVLQEETDSDFEWVKKQGIYLDDLGYGHNHGKGYYFSYVSNGNDVYDFNFFITDVTPELATVSGDTKYLIHYESKHGESSMTLDKFLRNVTKGIYPLFDKDGYRVDPDDIIKGFRGMSMNNY